VAFLIWARDFFCLSIYIVLILVLVKCFLCIVVKTTISVDSIGYTGSTKASSRLKSSFLFLSSESVGKLYHVSSSSSVYLSECLSLDELGGKESSDWLSDKLGKSNRPSKVAIITDSN
jgi:hypothetical protein